MEGTHPSANRDASKVIMMSVALGMCTGKVHGLWMGQLCWRRDADILEMAVARPCPWQHGFEGVARLCVRAAWIAYYHRRGIKCQISGFFAAEEIYAEGSTEAPPVAPAPAAKAPPAPVAKAKHKAKAKAKGKGAAKAAAAVAASSSADEPPAAEAPPAAVAAAAVASSCGSSSSSDSTSSDSASS